jgi:DNA-directed RNA polymerase subunit RPC12/RpoP
MKYTVQGTRYSTTKHYVELEVEVDNTRHAAVLAQDQAYAAALEWTDPESFQSTYCWQIGDRQFAVDDTGEMTREVVPGYEPDDEVSQQLFMNYYRCPDCSHQWRDTWSGACDDDCPRCGSRHISPYKSEDAHAGS